MIYTIYEPDTGHITNILQAESHEDALNHLQGRAMIEGCYDTHEYYIKDEVAIAKSPMPGPEYKYNYVDHTWERDSEYLGRFARIERNKLLSEVDAINPVRYFSLTTEQQTEIQAYRQALLDVPQQLGFPLDMSWPSKPAWL